MCGAYRTDYNPYLKHDSIKAHFTRCGSKEKHEASTGERRERSLSTFTQQSTMEDFKFRRAGETEEASEERLNKYVGCRSLVFCGLAWLLSKLTPPLSG